MNPIVVTAQPGSSCLKDFCLLGASLNSKKKNVKQSNMRMRISIVVMSTGLKFARMTWEVVIKPAAKAPKASNKKKVKIEAILCL